MLASSQLDLVLGLDIHFEILPPPAPSPAPFPMPFVGMIELDPVGLILQLGISSATSWAFNTPPSGGPVLVNGFPATKTGDEAKNGKTLPHIVIPPGVTWMPLPKPLKLKPKPGVVPPLENPAQPAGDAVMVTGSKTVYFNDTNACRLGTLAMSCGDPVRLPSSVLLAIPKGPPVLVGGPPAFDWSATLKTLVLRNEWTAGALHQLVSRMKPGRLRSLLAWAACELTGHPVDVATGRLLTRAKDFELRGPIPLVFERFYSSAWAERDSPLGYGWSHTFDERVWLERGKVVYKAGDGREIEFDPFDLPGRRMQEGQELIYAIDRLTLRCLGSGRWEVRTVDGLVREFDLLPGDAHTSRLTRIRNRVGQWVAFEYDAARALESLRTSEGRWARFEHSAGKLRRVALPYPEGDAGGWYDQVTFEYSAEGDLVRTIDSQRHARVCRYENHLLIEETDRDGVSFYFEYDGRDGAARCVRTWGDDKKGQNRLFLREITYDVENRRTFVEDSLGHTTTYEMNIANAVVKIVDPHGAATTREYDAHLWKISETDALGGVTRFEYDAHGNETKRVLPNGAAFTMRYDPDDQIVEMVDPLGVVCAWTYDWHGRLLRYASTAGDVLTLGYGEAPYPTRATRADGTSIAMEHDSFGQVTRLVFADGDIEQRWYDGLGQLVKVRDGTGRATRLVYDLEGRVVEVVLPGGAHRRFDYTPEGDVTREADPLGAREYAYRGFHKLAWHEQAGERIELRYDSEAELVAVINEDGDTYAYKRDACGRIVEERTFEGRRRTFTRDLLGNVTEEFLPDGQKRTFAYDVLGNVTNVLHPDGAEDVYAHDSVGNLTRATNAAGSLIFERDGRGRLIRERFNDDSVSSTYDSLGRRVEVTTSRGLAQRVARTAAGDVQAVGAWDRDPTGELRPKWHVGFERDAAGAELARRMPGGVNARWGRDAAGRASSQVITRGQDLLHRTDYQWEGIDRLVARTDTGRGRTDYLHDARGRLAGSLAPDGITTWRAPSRVGNLFKTEDRSDRRYGKGGVLLEDRGTTYAYDALGNVIEKRAPDGRSWKYTWNGAGMLASVELPDGEAVTFTYDALGRRVSKTCGTETTSWLWDGDVPVHELTSERGSPDTATSLTTWIFEPESFAPLAKLTPDGKRFSIVTDFVGSPTEMFDESGQLAWRAQLDIYGVARSEGSATGNCPWRSAGQYEDDETGLYYNRFRYYDPERGSYISQDPIRLLGGAELYGFVRDPLTWVDCFGLSGCNDASDRPAGRRANAQFVNLASPHRTAHIITGDGTGGGHMWPGAPGKTPFPQPWSAEEIMHAVSDIATDPALTWTQQTGSAGSLFTKSGAPARFFVTGVRDGVAIKVIIAPAGEGIITGFPF